MSEPTQTVAERVGIKFNVRDYADHALDLAGDCIGMESRISNDNGKGYMLSYSRAAVGDSPACFNSIMLKDSFVESMLVDAIRELSGIIAKQ